MKTSAIKITFKNQMNFSLSSYILFYSYHLNIWEGTNTAIFMIYGLNQITFQTLHAMLTDSAVSSSVTFQCNKYLKKANMFVPFPT